MKRCFSDKHSNEYKYWIKAANIFEKEWIKQHWMKEWTNELLEVRTYLIGIKVKWEKILANHESGGWSEGKRKRDSK